MKINPSTLPSTKLRFLQETGTLQILFTKEMVEYLWCLSPSYLFLILSIFRYYGILQALTTKKRIKLSVFKVIRILSCLMALTYAGVVIINFIDHQSLGLEIENHYFGVLYLVPIFAWGISCHMTSLEIKRGLVPAKYSQPLFCFLSLVASSYKTVIIETKILSLALCINAIQALLSLALLLCYLKLIRDCNTLKSGLGTTLMEEYQLAPRGFSLGYLSKGSHAYNFPPIKVEVKRGIAERKVSNAVNHYVRILVYIDEDPPYQVERSLSNFVELEKDLKTIYTLSRFPVLSTYLPLLDHHFLEKSLYQDTSKEPEIVEKLQTFLSELVERPGFMQEAVLDFLRIPGDYRHDFLAYVDSLEGKSSMQRSMQRSHTALSTENKPHMLDQRALEALDLFKLQTLQLEVHRVKYYRSEIENEVVYLFEMQKIENGEPKLTWTIAKSYNHFLVNHRRMETQLHMGVPKLQSFVPDVFDGEQDLNPTQLEKTLEGLERFLKTVLSTKKLYCTALLELIELDPVTWQKHNSVSERDFMMTEEI